MQTAVVGFNNEQEQGEFLYHEPCEQCGSSDAKAVYSTGTAYCFSCNKFFPSDGDSTTGRRQRVAQGLTDSGSIKALGKRKINEDTCRKYGYRVGKYKNRSVHIAPYYNHDGQLVAQHLRTPDKDFSWLGEAKKLQLFGQHLWRSNGKRLVITEGEIDCLSVAQVFNLKWPVVSVPNGAQSAVKYIRQNLEWIDSYDEVVIAFDNDEPGREAASECATLITPGKAKIANWSPYKDANDMLQDGKGHKIAEVIFGAKQYRPDGIVAGSELSLEYLQADEQYMSYEMPYPELSKKLKGLRKGEITLLTAGSGIGKSTAAREIAYHMLTEHNLKIGYVALEESVKKSALGFMAIKLNVPMGDLFLDKEIVSKEQFEQAYQDLIASDRLYFYDHFGSLESENLVSKMRFLATGLGVDFIILDHISIVVSGIEDGDERRIIDNLMTNLRSLVENTGVGMILISHLKVPRGTAHEEGGQVSINDLRGSGSLKQLSDNIVGIERNQQGEDPDISQIRLLKNRLFGFTGLCDTLKYNAETGRLLACDEMDDDEEFTGESEEADDVPF